MKVLKCPSCKRAAITQYMGAQFGKYMCKKCGYIGVLVIEEDIPSDVPKYYRSGFDSWLARLYDAAFLLVFLGKAQWLRDVLVTFIPARAERILDLATGTGAVALTHKKHFPKAKVFGMDLSQTMLAIAEKKARKRGLAIAWMRQNIEKTNFKRDYFDAVTISFGLHELPPEHRLAVLKEAHRVLRKNGRFVLMDFSRPKNTFIRVLFSIFLWIFEEPFAKTLLDQDLAKVFKKAGFNDVQRKQYSGNLVQIVVGKK